MGGTSCHNFQFNLKHQQPSMKLRLIVLSILLPIAACVPSCAVYDTVARTVGLPESSRPSQMRNEAAFSPESQTNIYDVEIQDSMIHYLEGRRSAR